MPGLMLCWPSWLAGELAPYALLCECTQLSRNTMTMVAAEEAAVEEPASANPILLAVHP